MTGPAGPALFDLARIRPVVLDAAIGTRLIALGLDLTRDDPALWNLDHPDAVASLHALDISAGSDAILTNTFGANRRWLDRFGRARDALAANRRAVALAREAAGPARFVIGSIGPTADDPATLLEQADALASAGVDALLLETFSPDAAAHALEILRSLDPLPRIVSLAPIAGPLDTWATRFKSLGASALGGNCHLGTAEGLALARRLHAATRLPIWLKPSPGLPGSDLEPPASFGAAAPALFASGVRFLGGCCGSDHAHVAAIRAACYPGPGNEAVSATQPIGRSAGP